MKPQPATLTGRRIRLEPLDHSHAPDLLEAAAHDEVWTYLDEPTPRTVEDIDHLIRDALTEQEQGPRLPFAVVRQSDDRTVGSTSYIDIRPAARTLEIGWTWMGPSEWGTGTNTEAKYLLLRHAFEILNAGRVAIKTDSRNARSRRAIENLGATHEGTWRNHRLLSTGSYRHTDYFSIIDSEWPSVRAHLEEIMAHVQRPDQQRRPTKTTAQPGDERVRGRSAPLARFNR